MTWRLRDLLAQAVVAMVVYGVFFCAEPLVDWLVPETPEVAQARADSTLRAAQLVVLRAERDSLAAWLGQARARLGVACAMLPFQDFNACVAGVDRKARRR
jgi:hypothetical protein